MIRIALEGGCYVRSSDDIICSVRGETTFGIVVYCCRMRSRERTLAKLKIERRGETGVGTTHFGKPKW